MSTFVILACLIRNVCPKLTNSYYIQLILQLYLEDTNNKSNLAVLKYCTVKNGFGTRTTMIFVGTRKYAKIRVPAPKSDTGTLVAFGICVAKDSLFLLGPIMHIMPS